MAGVDGSDYQCIIPTGRCLMCVLEGGGGRRSGRIGWVSILHEAGVDRSDYECWVPLLICLHAEGWSKLVCVLYSITSKPYLFMHYIIDALLQPKFIFQLRVNPV